VACCSIELYKKTSRALPVKFEVIPIIGGG
jgi:hypothetical protein